MLGLSFFFKDEELALDYMLHTLSPYVDEIVGVDDNSTDNSAKIVQSYGGRVYKCGLSDYASMRTIAAHLVRSPVVLMIDSDESLLYPERLAPLVEECQTKGVDAFALPRRRWRNLGMTREVEPGAYPDWQVRLFRNDPKFVFMRPVHEYFHGGAVVHLPYDQLPEIAHFNDVFHSQEVKKAREAKYKKLLARQGISAFLAENLQQSIQACSCLNTAQCEECKNKRDFIRQIMNQQMKWDEIITLAAENNISFDFSLAQIQYETLRNE